MIEVRCVVGEIRFEDVERAVAIIIPYGHAHSSLLVAVLAVTTSGHHGDVRERPIVIVVKKDAGFGVHGDVDVGPAIIVKVARNRGNRVARPRLENPRPFGNVGKRAVSIVAVKDIRSLQEAHAGRT